MNTTVAPAPQLDSWAQRLSLSVLRTGARGLALSPAAEAFAVAFKCMA